MRTSTSILLIAEALAAANAEIQNPVMNREVTVRPREGSPYSFSYATLDGILDGVRPILAKHGISIIQTVDMAERPQVVTNLLHKSGEWIGTVTPMTIDRPGNQAFGSAMTYARRYAILGLLCLAADPDEDGNAADGNEVQVVKDRQPPQRQAAQPQRDAHAVGQRAAAAAAAGAAASHAATSPRLSPEAAAARARMDALQASLVAKLGSEEANHQIDAIKKKNGADWRKSLAAVEALDQSIPKA